MKGLWQWTKDNISWIGSGISYTYQAVSDYVSSFTSSPVVRDSVHSASLKAWEGSTVVLEPSNVTRIANSPRARRGLGESFKANVFCYLSLAFLMEFMYQAITSRYSDEEDSYLESGVYLTMSTLMTLSLAVIMLHRVYDNTMINLAVSKQVSDENPSSKHFKPCGCDDGALISAGLFSTVNLYGKVGSIWAASYLPVIKYFTPLAYMFAYGESLAEFTYSAAGQCTQHRSLELSKHKAYSLGLGAMLYASGELISYLIYSQTGVNSFFIKNAVYAAIYPYFVTSVLLRNRPVPGDDKPGVELFYYHRYVLQHMVDNVGKQILPMLKSNVKTIDWKKYLQNMSEQAPVRMVGKLMSYDLYGDWKSVDGIIVSPSAMLFFDEYYALIKKQLRMVIDMRDKPLYKRDIKELVAPVVPVIPKRITLFFMTDSYRNLIKILFDQWLEDPLKFTELYLDEIRAKQIAKRENSKVKVKCYDRERLRLALEEAEMSRKHEEEERVRRQVTAAREEVKPLPLSQREAVNEPQQDPINMDEFVLVSPVRSHRKAKEDKNPAQSSAVVTSSKKLAHSVPDVNAVARSDPRLLSRSNPVNPLPVALPKGTLPSTHGLFSASKSPVSGGQVSSSASRQPDAAPKQARLSLQDLIIENYRGQPSDSASKGDQQGRKIM